MNTADRIREERRSMKMTQADLAEQLGIAEMTVRRWESGKSSPRIEDINRIRVVKMNKSVNFINYDIFYERRILAMAGR